LCALLLFFTVFYFCRITGVFYCFLLFFIVFLHLVDQMLGSKREVIFRDGCSADFKCAGLLLWLSMALGMRWAWNWFASCHGKTDECDAGGGTYKVWAVGALYSSNDTD